MKEMADKRRQQTEQILNEVVRHLADEAAQQLRTERTGRVRVEISFTCGHAVKWVGMNEHFHHGTAVGTAEVNNG
jgi:hypothetical protein